MLFILIHALCELVYNFPDSGDGRDHVDRGADVKQAAFVIAEQHVASVAAHVGHADVHSVLHLALLHERQTLIDSSSWRAHDGAVEQLRAEINADRESHEKPSFERRYFEGMPYENAPSSASKREARFKSILVCGCVLP